LGYLNTAILTGQYPRRHPISRDTLRKSYVDKLFSVILRMPPREEHTGNVVLTLMRQGNFFPAPDLK
jgi:hypothetical protein